jgi:hypothetical protein
MPVGASDRGRSPTSAPGRRSGLLRHPRTEDKLATRPRRARGKGRSVADSIDDQQFEQFCFDADKKTPSRAADELRRYRVPDEIVDALVARYEDYVGRIQEIGEPHFMDGGGRIPWYAGPRSADPCWWKLVASLRAGGFEDATLRGIDETTSRIMSLLEHPATATFKTQGLVLGHVQAGKTTNYTGVVAKAADRGYRLVIVLAGIHNELRRQTQNRLTRQLIDPNPTLWHQLTDPDRDFRPVANAPAFFAEYSSQRVLCVVKKNAAVLRKLIRWLETATDQLSSIPAIVIDDEADQAAVATQTINPLIRKLLGTLPRVAYVGYTATPFANLFIDPADDDLYPRDFIVDLPQPPGHFGTESIFGRDPLDGEDAGDYEDGSYDMVRIVPDTEVLNVRPVSDRDVADFEPLVAGELRRAILYFWLATAARRVRGTGVRHSTMLVHTSVRVAVHESFRDPIEKLGRETYAGVTRGDAPLIDELRQIWAQEVSRVPAKPLDEQPVEFDALLEELPKVVGDSRVILDNSKSATRLDYSGDPVVAIAVGGNTLSRGLTLEGLVVSFFVRGASAYDTLLQMGRWFGYREGYADLPRIWMTSELYGWFRHLAGVEAEIRLDIARYMEDDTVTPETFAVRVQTHPTLMITAAAKMKNAVVASSSFGGLRIQTRYFNADDDNWLKANQDAAKRLISKVVPDGGAHRADHFTGYLWRDVPAIDVLQFLDAYQVHDKAPNNSTHLIARYVRERNEDGFLSKWNVGIVGSATAGVGEFDFGHDVKVPKVIRAKLPVTPPAAADIKTLMSRRDAAVDLPVQPDGQLTESAIARERDLQLPDTPLLMLYPIDGASKTSRDRREPLAAVRDVIGVGLVFPKPPDGKDAKIYMQTDLTRVQESTDAYLEEEDLGLLEDEQL